MAHPSHHTQAIQLDLAPLEHESRRLFILGLLLGVVLHVLVVLFIPFKSFSTFERHIAKPFIVELLTIPQHDQRSYSVSQPSYDPRPFEKASPSDPTLPSVTTSQVGRYTLESNVITGIIDNDAISAAWGQAAETMHDSFLTSDYQFKSPDDTIPIRNQLFIDNGDLKTRIVFDPNRKQSIEGYSHYGVLWTAGNEPSTTSMLSIQHLAGEVTRLTNIELIYDNRINQSAYLPREIAAIYNSSMAGYSRMLDEYNARRELAHDYSFIFIPVDRIFKLTTDEYNMILQTNRFILMDNAGASYDDGQIDACIRILGYQRKNIEDEIIEFKALPRYHPVYHSFYDFDGPPPSTEAPERDNMDTIYGIYAHNPKSFVITKRFIGIYTPQGYTRSWADSLNIEQIKMGVNLVTFALAQYDTEYDIDTGEWYLTSEKRFLEK